jgi:hypothetical protein
MMNRISPDQPGYMPTYDEQGQYSATGAIACLTCHVAHTAFSTAENDPGTGTSPHMYLRAKARGSFCTDCHDHEALWRFLYYHKDNRNPASGMSQK